MVVVIIGGSDGIGKTTLVKLLTEGYTVYNLSRNKLLNLETNIYLDVSDTASIKNALDQVIAKEGKIDLIVYCAGFSMASPIEDVDSNDYRYLFSVNVFGYIETVKAITPHFKENKFGKIIYLSSLASKIPIPYDPYYSASKAAVEAFNNAINLELNKNNIYVTNLVFGGVKTNFTFKRKINTGKYSINFYSAVNSLAHFEQTGLEPMLIASEILKLSKTNNPPMTVTIGFKNKLMYCLSKALNPKLINRLVKIKFKQK